MDIVALGAFHRLAIDLDEVDMLLVLLALRAVHVFPFLEELKESHDSDPDGVFRLPL